MHEVQDFVSRGCIESYQTEKDRYRFYAVGFY
jgi:hypothetical protein